MLKELEAHRQDQYVSWFGIGLIHDALGEKALQWPPRNAHSRPCGGTGTTNQYPPFKTIAAEPAFQAIMRRVGR